MVSPIRPVAIPDLNPATGPSAVTAGEAADDAPGTGFGGTVSAALSDVGRRESAVKAAAEAAAVGDLQSVNDYMIAASEAQLATEITVAVRDRAISAFNDIMRMQI
jgi:flagellar hook-basal body complex protein FliE